MTGHWIRLRGGWERLNPETGDRVRMTLPATLPTAWPPTVHMVRAFNKPPLDTPKESLWLDLRRVSGICSVRLNDVEIARPAEGLSELRLLIENPRPSRNVLVLEMRKPSLAEPAAEDSLWGEIALVIVPIEP